MHKISGHKYKERPGEMGGGILADEMGMGKSLAILAIIMATLDAADKWAQTKNSEKSPHSRIETYSYGTLVVVPSACKSLQPVDTCVFGVQRLTKCSTHQ